MTPVPQVAASTPASSVEASAGGVARQKTFATGTLPNGLLYVIERVPEASVGMMLIIGAGGHDETLDQSNAAHVVEHILAASRDRPESTFYKLDEAGLIKLTGATTGQKRTRYSIEANSSYRGGPFKLLDGFIEWFSASIADSAVIRERASVGEEGRGGVTDLLKTQLEMQAKVYGSKNLSEVQNKWPRLSSLAPDAVRAFYTRWYRPDIATLVVSGDVDVSEWERAIVQEMSRIPVPVSPLLRSGSARIDERYVEFHPGRRNRIFVVNGGNDPRLRIRLISKSNAPRAESFAIELRQSLVSTLAEQVIYEIARARKFSSSMPIVKVDEATDVQVDSIFSATSIDPMESSEADTSAVRAATKKMVKQLAQIKQFGATPAEFETAKRRLRNDIASEALGDSERRLLRYAELIDQSPVEPFPDKDNRIAMLESISLGEMNGYLDRAIMFNRDFDAAIIGPASRTANRKLTAAIEQGIRDGLSQPMPPPQERVFLQRIAEYPGVVPDPKVEPIDTDTAAVHLPSGQALILRRIASSKGRLSDAIVVGARANNADLLRGSGQRLYTLGSEFVVRPAGLDADAFADFYNREEINSSIALRGDQSIISFSGPAGSLDSLLQAARIALTVGKEPVEISTGGSSSAVADGANVIDRARGIQVDREVVKERVSEAVRRFEPAVFVISGNFDPVEAAKLATRYFANSPDAQNNAPAAVGRDLPTLGLSSDNIIEVAGGADRGSPTARHYSLAFQDSPAKRAAFAISVQLLNETFFTELRNAGGYDARVGSRIWPDARADGKAIIDVTFAYGIDSARADAFAQLADAVIGSAASGQLDRGKFDLAKQMAISKALARRNNAREFGEMTVQRLLASGNPRDALQSEAEVLASVSYEEVQKTVIWLLAGSAVAK